MTLPAKFTVTFTAPALADLVAISDQRTQQSIFTQAQKLEIEPLKQGKPLTADLKGYRSIRAAGQRYRIIYQVALEPPSGTVVIVVVGIRQEGSKKDAYRIASKRLG